MEVIYVLSEIILIIIEVGEEIVVVDKGVLLIKILEGLKLISSLYKVLFSGNVEVKVSDGKMKVLLYIGEKFIFFFFVLGSFFVLILGFFFFKKNKKKV